MIPPEVVMLRVCFSLLVDALSRAFNYARLTFFLSFAIGIVGLAWRMNHFHDGTWLLDLGALAVITQKLLRWIRIEA
jgi:hypothetical protein